MSLDSGLESGLQSLPDFQTVDSRQQQQDDDDDDDVAMINCSQVDQSAPLSKLPPIIREPAP